MRNAPLLALVLLTACSDKSESPDKGTTDLTTAAPLPPAPEAPAARASKPAPAELPTMQALGTEPFWSIKIDAGTLTWSSPDDMPGTSFAAVGKAQDGGWRYTGTLKGETAELVIAPGECSDGMSDTVYPYAARFAWGTQRLSGCARMR